MTRTLFLLAQLAVAQSQIPPERHFVRGEEAYPAAFLQSGELVATLVRGGQPEIWILARTGAPVRRVKAPANSWAGDVRNPAGVLVVEQYVEGVSDLNALNLESGAIEPITRTPWNEWHPDWSPDGRWLAFDIDSAGRSPRLVLQELATGRRELLTRGNLPEQGARWSPDGRSLAFHRRVSGGTAETYDVFIIERDTKHETRLTQDGADTSSPEWSPDGDRIAFSSNVGGSRYAIYLVCRDGSGRVNVSRDGDDARYPRWSPDGAGIVYQVRGNGLRMVATPEKRCAARDSRTTARPSSAEPFQIDTAALTRAALEEMRNTRAPGVAVAVVSGDRIVYERGFGVESSEGAVPVTPATLFRIGSTTKMVTGLAALLLESRGTLGVSSPIAQKVKGLAPVLGSLTMHQLLSHSAGLVNGGAGMGPQDDAALGQLVRGWGTEMILAPPNDVYSYSSPGYWLAGHVIEEAGGKPYADVVRDIVLAPLGMSRSTFRPLVAMTYPLAKDHRVYPDSVVVVRPFPNDVTTWASGSLFSSVHELARLTIALLNAGTIDGRQVLPAAVVESLTTPRAPTPNPSCAYTYGLMRCSSQGRLILSHSGFRGGSGSIISLAPQARFAVIVLSNRHGGIFHRTAAAALAQLPKAGPTDIAASAKPVAIEPNAVPGVYSHGGDSIRVVRRDARLLTIRGTDTTRARFDAPNTLALMDSSGTDVGGFVIVRGRHTGDLYLHDGLEAYRRAPSR